MPVSAELTACYVLDGACQQLAECRRVTGSGPQNVDCTAECFCTFISTNFPVRIHLLLSAHLVSAKLEAVHFACLKKNLFALPKAVFCSCKILGIQRTSGARRVGKEAQLPKPMISFVFTFLLGMIKGAHVPGKGLCPTQQTSTVHLLSYPDPAQTCLLPAV